MRTSMEQIRAEPEGPVKLFDWDVAILIGLLATAVLASQTCYQTVRGTLRGHVVQAAIGVRA